MLTDEQLDDLLMAVDEYNFATGGDLSYAVPRAEAVAWARAIRADMDLDDPRCGPDALALLMARIDRLLAIDAGQMSLL